MFVIHNSTVFYLHADEDYALKYDEHKNVVKVEKHNNSPSREFFFSFVRCDHCNRNNQCIV